MRGPSTDWKLGTRPSDCSALVTERVERDRGSRRQHQFGDRPEEADPKRVADRAADLVVL
jgi:hypothetical protein